MLCVLSVVNTKKEMLLTDIIWNTYGKNKMYGERLLS